MAGGHAAYGVYHRFCHSTPIPAHTLAASQDGLAPPPWAAPVLALNKATG